MKFGFVMMNDMMMCMCYMCTFCHAHQTKTLSAFR